MNRRDWMNRARRRRNQKGCAPGPRSQRQPRSAGGRAEFLAASRVRGHCGRSATGPPAAARSQVRSRWNLPPLRSSLTRCDRGSVALRCGCGPVAPGSSNLCVPPRGFHRTDTDLPPRAVGAFRAGGHRQSALRSGVRGAAPSPARQGRAGPEGVPARRGHGEQRDYFFALGLNSS